jgi:hypothetical protein
MEIAGLGIMVARHRGAVGRGRVAVDAQDDRVLVFGCSGLGLVHAEAFRADNGKNLFRFSNTYSEWR